MLNRVLVLAPHTDDGEFGCGGTMAGFINEGKEVFYVAFSAAETSLPPEYPRDTLRREVKEAMVVLGLPAKNLIVLAYPVREFPAHRQKILDDLLKMERDFKPNMVLLPATHDTHQDHQVVSQEGFRAFKRTTILGYELPWNNLTFSTEGFVALTEAQLEKKIQALACYRTQQDRSYAAPDFIRSLARTRGIQLGCQYAEAFEVIRWVIG